METVISVDIGTSSLKAAIISSKGDLLAFARRELILHNTEHAAKEWFCALQDAVKELFEQNPSVNICAMCISGNGPTLVAPDGTTLLWNAQLKSNEDFTLNTKSLFIPRLLEFKKRFALIWKESNTIFSGPEYLIFLLTNKAFTILPQERYKEAYWDTNALLSANIIEANQKLPPFTSPSCKAGEITEQVAQIFNKKQNGLVCGLPVYCGAPDFISAMVGTNTLQVGSLCDRAGSSEGLNLCTHKPLFAENIRTLPSICSSLWNASYLLPESGTRFYAYKQKIERLQGSPVDLNVLVNKCIKAQENKEPFIEGKNLVMQTAMQVKQGITTLINASSKIGIKKPDAMTVTGGQASNDTWNQLKSNVTSLKIIVPTCKDAELLGNAVFAFKGMGLFSSIEQGANSLFKPLKIFYPE